jgi:hypothetical protein
MIPNPGKKIKEKRKVIQSRKDYSKPRKNSKF